MSDFPPVAGRVLAFILVLGLLVSSLPAVALAQDPEPVAVSDAFEVSGDAAGAETLYRWEISETAGAWQLDVTGPPEEGISLELLAEDLTRIDRTKGTAVATLFDLALAPGTYVLRVPRSPRDALPFTLASSPVSADYDPEPNDDAATAAPIAVGDSRPGRLADAAGDADHFRLVVDATSTALIDIALESPAEVGRVLCLLDDSGADRTCRSGGGSLQLTDLRLDSGEHVLRVRGPADPGLPYALHIEAAREQSPDYEAEPNDDPAVASTLDVELGVSGRSESRDPDFYEVTIEGEPQLWRWEASGPDIDRFALVTAGGVELQAATLGHGGAPAAIDDLFLSPGAHMFRIRTRGGPYRIEATPLGAPDPDAEREPNSDPLRAEAYRIGQRRVGRLVSSDDMDFMRFTVAAPEHLRFRLRQAPDADIDVQLDTGHAQLLRRWAATPGADLEMNLWLDPGDYLLRLAPRQASPDPYELTIERADPFLPVADLEPNDRAAFAAEAPPGLRWTSDDGSGRDVDWYRLPELVTPSSVAVGLDTDGVRVRLHAGPDAEERLDLAEETEGVWHAVDVPAGVPLYLEVETGAPYEIELDSPGWTPQPLDPAPEVGAVLSFDNDELAAYWPQAQALSGSLALTNEGSEPISLELEAVSSHFAWQPTVVEPLVTLAPGATRDVGVEVEVGPDVWAHDPVQITVAARPESASPVTASAIVEATPDAPAVAPHLGWSVPDAVLGGLNVASLALGGVPAGTVHPDREPFLFDGVTPAGGGFGVSVDSFPAELIVDLAGEQPVPVAGTIINPLARGSSLSEVPRSFEFLLSTDGETWTPALSGEISPLPADQVFVLDEPLPATHAMLRILSLRAGNSRTVALGEWKVVAEPGATPDDMSANIADPIRGGRVVRQVPGSGSWDYQVEVIDGEPKRGQVATDREAPRFETVIGFQDGRAAQVESLSWIDPDGSDPETRLDSVDVELSTESPLGPWQDAGTWLLARDDQGLVEDLRFDTARWARFVRLSTDLPEGTRLAEWPAAIRVNERPTDDEYRSILGEWGYTSRRGPYELLVPATASAADLGPDAADTRELATPLALDALRVDSAEILEDTDWYRIEIPLDHNTLTIELGGVPNVGVGLTLFDPGGVEQPGEVLARTGGGVGHEWIVEPGTAYDLRIEQPPFSFVFTFDTSGSMGPYLHTVMEGVREFAADVKPGREAAMIVPFEDEPLLDEWEDRPEVLVDAVNRFDLRSGSSSAAVVSLLTASELLAQRDGARAVLIVTDAETGGLDVGEDVWQSFERVQPVVYSVHVGATGRPVGTRNLMQSWAHANGGHYSYPTTHGEMDREFERMSTQLRRPATYSLLARTSGVNRDPALLTVVAPEGQPAALAPGVGIEIILDTSGSMRKRLDGTPRIKIAKASLRALFSEALAEGVPLAVRTFGGKGKGKKARCETRLTQPLAPLKKAKALKLVRNLSAPKKVRTPLGAAIEAVAADLVAVEGTRIVVLVTDGNETCGGDPHAAIEGLKASGIDVNVNIVGFALEDEALKEQMAVWAAAGGGRYYDASIADELAASLAQALAAPFRVYAPGREEPLANGTVGGAGVLLDPGTYRVEVVVDPPVAFEDVIIEGSSGVSLSLPATEGTEDG